jgi:SAM-dependent methyltransferase
VSFDVAAEAYDRFMGRYSRLLSRQMAEFARVRAGQRALDVGCGPGALTAELVTRLGPSAVTAVDPSEPFVHAARARNPGVAVERASADDLPFPDGAFDAVLAQLVVHFMADPVAGLLEMTRVTRRDGVVAACVWDHAGGQGPLGAFWHAARELDPGIDDESQLPGAREATSETCSGPPSCATSRRRRSPPASSTRRSTSGGSHSPAASGPLARMSPASTRLGGPYCATHAALDSRTLLS